MEHNHAQLGERDSSAIRGTVGHVAVASFFSHNLCHTGCRSSVPLFVPDVVEVVPWSLSHQDEWWCDVEWGGGGYVPTRIGSSTKPCQLEVHLPSINLNTVITLNRVQVVHHL